MSLLTVEAPSCIFNKTITEIAADLCKYPICPLCAFANTNGLEDHLKKAHLKYTIEIEADGEKVHCLPCKLECAEKVLRKPNGILRSHYHCPFCHKIITRSSSFKRHTVICDGTNPEKDNKSLYEVNEENNTTLTNMRSKQSNVVKNNMEFVQEVEKYEELYNPFCHSYDDIDARERAWSAVAAVVHEDEEQCKLKWKRLKSGYCQHLQYASDDGRCIPKHYLHDCMEFIMPYLRKPDSKNEPSTIEIVTDSDLEDLTRTSDPIVLAGSDETFQSEISRERSPSWKREMTESPESFYNESPLKRSRYEDKGDPDMSFFRSLLPDIKKMTSYQKSCFKRHTLGIIEDILYGNSAVQNEDMSMSSVTINYAES